MRRKWLTMGVSLGIGAVMLLVSGFSAMAKTSGYDAYKAALKNTSAVNSLAANAELVVTDNGMKVIGAKANIKHNHERNTGSTEVTFADNNSAHTLNVFRQDGKVIFKNSESDVYRVLEHNAAQWKHDGVEPKPSAAAEQAIDALVGNLRELATVENESDDSMKAALHLSGNQIPTVVNALGPLVISKIADADQDHQWDQSSGKDDQDSVFTPGAMKLNFPKLTNHITVEEINFDAKITADRMIEQQMAEIKITGQDHSGNNHDIVIKLHVNFSDFNQSQPDQIDLTGKQIKTISNESMNRGWQRKGWNK